MNIRLYPSHSNAYQTKVLREETQMLKENPIMLNEGIMIPCDYQDSIKKYIMSESNNVKDAINHLELDPDKASIANDGKMSISIKTEEGKMILFTEDNIRKEINEFLKNISL